MSGTFPVDQIAVLSGHGGPVHAVKWSAGTGQYVLTGSADRTIRLFNPLKATNQITASGNGAPSGLIQSYTGHGYEVLDIAITTDNSRFASVSGDRHVLLWDVTTGKTLRNWTGHNSRVNTVDIGGEGSVIVSGSYDATVRIWDCKSSSTKPIQVLDEATDSVSSLQVVDHEILVASTDGRCRIYDLRMGMVYVDIIGASATSIHATKDGNAYLVSTLDSTIRLMDKGNGKLLQSYKGHTNKDYRIRSTLAQADATVVSGSEDGAIFVWDLLKGDLLAKLQGHSGKVVSCCAWNSSSGRNQLASATDDGNVIIWGTKS